MAIGKIKARRVGDIEDLKKRNKKSAGDQYTLRVQGDTEVTVRFTTEPDKWVEYTEHYLEDHEPRFFPCNDEDCDGCDEGARPSSKWAASVIEITDERGGIKPRVFVFPKQVQEKLVRKFDKYHTILDRDYTVIRTGKGITDTDYDVENEGRTKMDLKKFKGKIPDAYKTIVGALKPQTDDDDDEDEADEEETPRRRSRGAKKPTAKKSSMKRRTIADEDDEDEEWEPTTRRRPTAKKTTKKSAKRSLSRR